MKKQTKTLLLLCLSLTLAVSLIGCAPSTEDAWQKIKNAGVITVGTSPDYPPFETVDDDGKIIGFDIDLLTAMASEMGVDVEFKPMNFDTIVTAVQSGQIDIGMSGFSVDPERDVAFSNSYYSGGQVLLTTTDSGVTGVESLDGKTVAVQMGTTGEKAANTIPGANVKALDDFGITIQMLKSGTVKAVVADQAVAKQYVHHDGLVIVGEPLAVEENAIVVKKGNIEVLEAVNEALAKVKASEKYEELLEKWAIK